MERTINNPNYQFIQNRSCNNPTYDSDIKNHIYETIDEDRTEIKLPNNWIKLYDIKSGKPYYAFLTTKHTQWLNHLIPIGTMMTNGLPYGIEEEFDKNTNMKYYINHINKKNSWNYPI